MADSAVQTAVYKLAYDTSGFEAGQKIIEAGNAQTIGSFERLEGKLFENIRVEQRRHAEARGKGHTAEVDAHAADALAVEREIDAIAGERAVLVAAIAAEDALPSTERWKAAARGRDGNSCRA